MSILLRRCLLTVSVTALSFAMAGPGACFAAESATVPAQNQTPASPAESFVQDVGSRAIKIIANKQLTVEQRTTEFSKVLNDSFDLYTIGRFVIGRAWNAATPAQQTEYMDLFRALVIRNYGDRMTLYTGEGFHVVGARPESDTDTTILSQITHPDGSKPTSIDWRVRQKEGKAGIIDVVVEGVSLSVTQRQEYSTVIQSHGGQIDGLLQTMRDQLKALPNVANAVK